jgi:histidinol-phosphate/aromatic aminotransferase/cobyric acid decarboxylase-like protein
MNDKKHWSVRIAEAYGKKELPDYDTMEEAVSDLLQERETLRATIRAMGGMLGAMVVARRANNIDGVVSALDGFMSNSVTFTAAMPATVQ